MCDIGACISSDFYCDNHPDCIDNSDEPPGCSGREITDFHFSQSKLVVRND